MSRVDKTEDSVQRVYRDYQDQWSRYAEQLEKKEGSAKVRPLVVGRGWRGQL